MSFVGTELHKTFGPLFRPGTPEEFKSQSKEALSKRIAWLDKELAGKQYLMGNNFTVADAYLFTVLRWSPRVGLDLSKSANVMAYIDRVTARPKVQEALCRRTIVTFPTEPRTRFGDFELARNHRSYWDCGAGAGHRG
jgi:glutathione S-transferase